MGSKCLNSGTAAVLATVLCAAGAMAQTSRISQPLDNRQRTVLAGHLHPKAMAAARAGNDQGRVAPSLAIPYITLTLAPSPSQQADLEKLLVEQQTPGSPQLSSLANAGRIRTALRSERRRSEQDHPMASSSRACKWFRWRAGGTGSRPAERRRRWRWRFRPKFTVTWSTARHTSRTRRSHPCPRHSVRW